VETAACHHRIGNIHFARGSFRDALDSYLQALQIEPQRTGVYFDLQATFEALGQHQEARDAYLKGVAVESRLRLIPQKAEHPH